MDNRAIETMILGGIAVAVIVAIYFLLHVVDPQIATYVGSGIVVAIIAVFMLG